MRKLLGAAATAAILLPMAFGCSNSKDIATTDPTTTTESSPTSSTPETTPTSPTPPTPISSSTPATTPPTSAPLTTATPTDNGDRLAGTGFSIAIPADWEDITSTVKPNNPQLDIAIGESNPTKFRTNFNVVTASPTTADLTDDEAAIRKQAAAELKGVTHAAVNPLPDGTIDGESALGQTSTFVTSGSSVTFLQYLTIHNGMAYPVTMTFATANAGKAAPMLATILASWQWAG